MDPAPPRKLARKSLQGEYDQRIAAATELLIAGKSDGEIKRAVAEQFGLSPRSVERYLRRAREEMVKSTGKPADIHRAEALAVYQRIIDDPEAEDRDKIAARTRIDKLLGLEIHAPQRVELSGPEGQPIQSQSALVTVDLGRKVEAVMPAIQAALLSRRLELLQERQDPS